MFRTVRYCRIISPSMEHFMYMLCTFVEQCQVVKCFCHLIYMYISFKILKKMVFLQMEILSSSYSFIGFFVNFSAIGLTSFFKLLICEEKTYICCIKISLNFLSYLNFCCCLGFIVSLFFYVILFYFF